MVEQALILSLLTAAETAAIQMVLDGLPSEHSRRAYERALVDFFRWHKSAGRPALNKVLVGVLTALEKEPRLRASATPSGKPFVGLLTAFIFPQTT